MEARGLIRSGLIIKVARNDDHILLDIRGPVGDPGFHGVVTPGRWKQFERSIATAKKMMVKAGWLPEDPQRPPGPGRGSLLHLVKNR